MSADFDAAESRKQMVEDLRRAFGRDAITNARVIEAMGTVPRHEFVSAPVRGLAYSDRPLPIGHGQTISQPYIVAFMTEQLDPQPHQRILEIGTGSGYQAAILARLAAHVYSVEIIDPLARQAQETFQRLNITNVTVRSGDGYAGWPEHAPYDAVIVTCAPDKIPQPLVDQLREGGRMIIPVGQSDNQELVMLRKAQGKIVKQAVLPVRFVPMTRAGQPPRIPQTPSP